MTSAVLCPICHGGPLRAGDGKLEQSGDSYLPTVVWRCALCEYTRYEPAPHARWQPAHAAPEPEAQQPEPVPVAPRRAA